MDTIEDMAEGTRVGGLPRGGEDKWDRESPPKFGAKLRLWEWMGLQGDDVLTWGGEAEDEVPFELFVCLKFSLLGLDLLPVSMLSELLAEEAPLDRHIALSNEN